MVNPGSLQILKVTHHRPPPPPLPRRFAPLIFQRAISVFKLVSVECRAAGRVRRGVMGVRRGRLTAVRQLIVELLVEVSHFQASFLLALVLALHFDFLCEVELQNVVLKLIQLLHVILSPINEQFLTHLSLGRRILFVFL